jgi:hypothetical protein
MKHIDLCGHGRSASRRRVLGLAVLAAASLYLAGCGSSGHPKAAGAVPYPSTSARSVSAGPAPASPTPAGPLASTPPPTATQSAGTRPPAPVPANQLPGNANISWQDSTPRAMPTAQDVRLNECQSIHGATQWQQEGYAASNTTLGGQDTFVFPDSGAAQAAYKKLVADMAGCQEVTRTIQRQAGVAPDAVVRQTAQLSNATAWARQWTGVEGVSAGGAQTNHIYAAVVGATVSVVQLSEPGAPPAHPAIDTNDDAAALATLTAHLGS